MGPMTHDPCPFPSSLLISLKVNVTASYASNSKKTQPPKDPRVFFSPECFSLSKKSPTGPTERTSKPEYLIARSQLTERNGVRWESVPFNF